MEQAKWKIGVVLILLTVSACGEGSFVLEPDPESIGMDEILQLTGMRFPSEMVADGTSEDILTARIPKGARERAIVFKTTTGTFPPENGTETTVRATLDPNNPEWMTATVRLRAGTVPGVAFVKATVGGFADTLSITFTPADAR